jgi:hypothetical protein
MSSEIMGKVPEAGLQGISGNVFDRTSRLEELTNQIETIVRGAEPCEAIESAPPTGNGLIEAVQRIEARLDALGGRLATLRDNLS